ncbi:peptidase C14 [Desulfopila sp. IMCC35006]|uniref:caspase family protein n=1 Tax=Desulfopila sp. IMCC35006 TaxID=2569542 RepID=UPI0010AC222B|nr:caspase family protein [Desulfopila sp. IMCC35006]TKB24681.1 peptidase C14 [Desulfopila sp. IMCC35006]
MAKPFYPLTLEEFINLLNRFRFTRKIDAVHMHHTWRPNHSQYQGVKSIEGMWRYHTQENGWSDIAQHISIAPDGTIWTGRDWNAQPVSARGYNGTRISGPFMFEIIGDFDRGCDPFAGAQRAAVLGVIASVQEKFGLPLESLRFHNFMTDQKTCPGNAIVYQDFLAEVQDARSALVAQAAEADNKRSMGGFDANGRLAEILHTWSRTLARGSSDPADAEPDESEMTFRQIRMITGMEGTTVPAPGAGATRGGGSGKKLSPEELDALRPHVINLNQGRFSREGIFQTTPEDVDAIFDEYLANALAKARANGRPLKLLLYAHGGLVAESDGLWIAHLQVEWWKKNNIYPIHFVWETGFFDAIKQILSGARSMAAERGLTRDFWDYTTDPAIEALARALGGAKIWSAMKESGRLASDESGGATYTAKKLAAFCGNHPNDIELHAVGHSAGSIFHSWFLPRAIAEGVPAFASLHFLAPAIRVDAFKERLLAHIGNDVRHLTMFTMKKDWEKDDSVAKIYQKSLLYLIYYALESNRKTPILGLEESLRKDVDTANLFGLKGTPSQKAEIVWSVSQATTGSSASTSRTHGGFDNDRPTMNSVARRILDSDDIVDFPEEALERGLPDLWDKPVLLPPEFEYLFRPPVQPCPPPSVPAPPTPADPAPTPEPADIPAPAGRRQALCVGIDDYPTAPLNGCVADADAWGATLGDLGFQVSSLKNAAATRNSILAELKKLIESSTAGDVVVFQFAGHGTEVDDLDGDEVDGTNGPKDEALCPYDIAEGAFVIDDDIADIFADIPPGVNVTCFIDCCHSGSITRAFMGSKPLTGERDLRARFLPATPEMQAKHRAYRERLGSSRSAPGRRPENLKNVLFSACRDYEVAYESAGHGEFTVRATKVLRQGIEGITNEDFQNRVIKEFGPVPRQNPELDCAPYMNTLSLLKPLVF